MKNADKLNKKNTDSSMKTEETSKTTGDKTTSIIKLLDTEQLELKWKEGTDSYSIGIEFLKMVKHFFSNGTTLFNTPKKGEDKENYKQTSFEAILSFIENQCHLI